MKTKTFPTTFRSGFGKGRYFSKSNGQRFKVTAMGFDREIECCAWQPFINFVEFQEVRKEKELGEYQEILVGEVFSRSLIFMFECLDGLHEDMKLILEM